MRKAVFGEMRGLKGIVVLAVVVAVMSVLASENLHSRKVWGTFPHAFR